MACPPPSCVSLSKSIVGVDDKIDRVRRVAIRALKARANNTMLTFFSWKAFAICLLPFGGGGARALIVVGTCRTSSIG